MTEVSGPARELLSGGRVVICDGAMGTMLHSAGIALDESLGELNLSRPALVRDVHRAYLGAGAQLVQTNTFDSNRLRLSRAGLANRVSEINIAGARIAREAVERSGTPAVVAGSVGPPTGAGLAPRISPAERASVVREQIAALADWVDLIVLETFGDVDALASAAEIAGSECDLPVLAQLTFGYDGRTLRGEEPEAAAAVLSRLDVAAIGANCTVGPAVLQDVVAALARGCDLPISVQPNAGAPKRRGTQLRYAHNVDYFAEAARQFLANGAAIVGGCCGTTPAHIRAMAKAVGGGTPIARERVARPAAPRVRAVPSAEPGTPAAWPTGGFAVVAGMRAPRDVEVAAFLEQAERFVAAGVDHLAIVDPDPSEARVNPVAAAVLLQQRVGPRVILQVEAADRSLAALQADLLGAHALGLHIVVCRAGAPYVAGGYPEPDSPWDVDAARLVGAVAGLNDGLDWRGVPMNSRTRFSIGASLSTAADDRAGELTRVAAKVRAGAGFLLTEPIYDVPAAREVLLAARQQGIEVPVIAGVAPFEDAVSVARLTSETPEVSIRVPVAGRDPAELLREVVADLGDLVAGVLVHAPTRPDARMSELLAQVQTQRRSS